MKSILVFILATACVLQACAPAPQPQPTAVPPTTAAPSEPPAPTATTVPTDTPVPTEPAKPTGTSLPEGVLFRDDFNGELQPGWQWENENPARWSFTPDGWLQIIGEPDSLLAKNARQTNLLWYPLPPGDFAIAVHLKTKPFANFHQAAIFLYQDPDNYVTINRGYCGVCSTAGNGFYMDYKIGGEWGDYRAATSAEDVYLRLESKGSVISGYYATAPDQWTRLGRFGNYFQFQKVGIGVSNAGAQDDVLGQYDYFEISTP
ncbi:MAG: hypothetical protein ACM3QS_16395 [Bacteroidota bacterium]